MARKGSDDSKLWAFLAMLLGLLGFVLVLLIRKSDKYAMYYAKQSLVLSLVAIILPVALMITVVGAALTPIAGVLILIWWVIGLINSLSGKQKPLPLIGKFAEKLKL